MVDPDVVARRLLALNEAMQHLRRPEAGDAVRLASDAMLRAAVERWLQVAIEACADIATHVVADEGWTPPGTARESFLVLASHGKLPHDLAKRMGTAVGLRNILVHDYVSVNLDQLARTIREDLGDLANFAGCVEQWIES